MKPIGVLAPGIENRSLTAGTVYEDEPFRQFRNYGGNFRGPMTMRQSSAISQNIPFLKAVIDVGTNRSIEFLRSIGLNRICSERDNNIASLALGGLTYGSNALEMAGAYGAFANGGVFITPTFYTKVTDSNGNVVREAQQETRRVMSEAAAFVVTEVLMETGRTGTATNVSVSGMQVASKTGTTNNHFDRWFVGYTPHFTGAVWFGFDENETVRWSGANPGSLIWNGVMRPSHQGMPGRSFTRPDGVVTASICRISGLLPTTGCTRRNMVYTEFFVRGTVPTGHCHVHR